MKTLLYCLLIASLTSCGWLGNGAPNTQLKMNPLVGSWGTLCQAGERTAYIFNANSTLIKRTILFSDPTCLGAPTHSSDGFIYNYLVDGDNVTLNTGTTTSALTFQWSIENGTLYLKSAGQVSLKLFKM